MNVGSYIFPQVVDFIPRYQFDKLVAKYHGDWHAKDLSCYNQLLHLLFGQITGCGSLRDICLCLEAHSQILYHLGFRNTVNQSSLSRANENRDYRIYEELGTYLIGVVRPLYSRETVSEITIDNVLYALDSTTISTSIKLATWALGKYSRGAVKMHTLLDLRGSIPANIHITHGRWHDSNELDFLKPEPYAFYMMDKAYVDFDALFRFHIAGAYWVSRPKENMRYEILSHRPLTEADRKAGITGDFTIRLTTKSVYLYPEPIRAVCLYDEEAGEEIVFITNNFDISASEVACLYRHRWDIEVFFKWIKQNIAFYACFVGAFEHPRASRADACGARSTMEKSNMKQASALAEDCPRKPYPLNMASGLFIIIQDRILDTPINETTSIPNKSCRESEL